MLSSSPKQRCFPPGVGQTLRADFEGGALSSDCGPLLLRGVDRQIDLTERLATAIHEKRHLFSLDHPMRDLLAQQIYPIASGYADGNDAKNLRHDPVFKLGSSVCPWMPRRIEPAPRLSHGSNTVWTARTALVSPRPWWTNVWPATQRPPRPSCSTSITPMIPPMASRNVPSLTMTTGAIALCPSGSLRGRHMRWERQTSSPWYAPRARRTP
jgi:hypothetical protein